MIDTSIDQPFLHSSLNVPQYFVTGIPILHPDFFLPVELSQVHFPVTVASEQNQLFFSYLVRCLFFLISIRYSNVMLNYENSFQYKNCLITSK